jgi:hypothetical protein
MKQTLLLSQEQFTNWLVALRSGQYNQGTLLLRTENKEAGTCSHCCLGVLCEVSGFTLDKFGGYYKDEVTLCRSSHAFPSPNTETKDPIVTPSTVEQYNFEDYMYSKTGFHIGYKRLSDLNDSGHFTFSDIADIIEMFFEPTTTGN